MTMNVVMAFSVCNDQVTSQYQDVMDHLTQALTIVFYLKQQLLHPPLLLQLIILLLFQPPAQQRNHLLHPLP